MYLNKTILSRVRYNIHYTKLYYFQKIKRFENFMALPYILFQSYRTTATLFVTFPIIKSSFINGVVIFYTITTEEIKKKLLSKKFFTPIRQVVSRKIKNKHQ